MVSNLRGEPYAPGVLNRYRVKVLTAAGVRHIKLHGGRHSCATLMGLQGVPVAVIAAWIGHKDASLTTRLHLTFSKRSAEGRRGDLGSSCHPRVTDGGFEHLRTMFPLFRRGADDGNRTRVFSLGS